MLHVNYILERTEAHTSHPFYPCVPTYCCRSPFEILSGSKKKKKSSRGDEEEDLSDEDERDRGGNVQPSLKYLLSMFRTF
jgi:hypothetical protein